MEGFDAVGTFIPGQHLISSSAKFIIIAFVYFKFYDQRNPAADKLKNIFKKRDRFPGADQTDVF